MNTCSISTTSDNQGISGFSLIELLAVIAVTSILLAVSVPNLMSLSPSRKSALYEVKGFLEYARSESLARNREVYVAFANESFPGNSGPFRAYAAFLANNPESDGPDENRELIQLSEWKSLPEGIVFVKGGEFETVSGSAFRTVFDLERRHTFETRIGSNKNLSVDLPFLRFGADGRISSPSFINADALHVGIAEGFFSKNSSKIHLTKKRPASSGSGEYAQAECIAINFYTGHTRVITE